MEVRYDASTLPPTRGVPSSEAATPGSVEESSATHQARRRGRWLIIGVAGGASGLLVVMLGVALILYWQGETFQHQRAQRAFKEKQFGSAAHLFDDLLKKFSESSNTSDYRFMRDFARMQADLGSLSIRSEDALAKARAFLDEHRGHPLLKQHSPEYGNLVIRLIKAAAPDVAQKAALEKGPDLLDQLDRQLTDAKSAFPEAFPAEEIGKAREVIEKARVEFAKRREREEALAKLGTAKPNADGIVAARKLIDAQEQRTPGFKTDPEVVQRLNKLYDAHLASVKFEPAGEPENAPALRAEDIEPGLLVQLGEGSHAPLSRDDAVVLALVRGVLYFLSQGTGRIVYAMRVGIDTAALPVRVPAAGGRPELILVLSADTETLSALDTEGRQLWTYRLSAPCLSRPVVVDVRAYVPTYDGKVHEIELAGGQLLGRYDLGQPLSLGGVRQDGTKRICFPADHTCVYVLDVEKRECSRILYSDHTSGSLRSAPLLAGPGPRSLAPGEMLQAGAPEGYLVLAQTDGLHRMVLRAFGMPIEDRQAQPLSLRPNPRVGGWLSFPPYLDAEKLLLASDDGEVGLFGIRQVRNEDNALFPLMKDAVHLAPANGHSKPGRAQVVHAQEDDFWVLTQGSLHRLRVTLDRKEGRKLVRVWDKPVSLGSPLHLSQVDARGNSLFLVTQSLERQACLATAVDADSGKVLWQRQLGFVCQGEPLAMGPEVLAQDVSGAVLGFAARDLVPRPNEQWRLGGRKLAGPLDENPEMPPVLLPGPDGRTAYQVAFPRQGKQMVIRRFELTGGQISDGSRAEKTVNLLAAPASHPCVTAGGILLALTNRQMIRVPFPPDPGRGLIGPPWRAKGLPPEVRGHIVWVGEDDFVISNGSRGLTHWRWPVGQSWSHFPPDRDPSEPTHEVRARVVAPPAVVRSKNGEMPLQICVADAEANGGLTLLEGDNLKEVRRWEATGRVTAGPFVRRLEEATRIGCVVDRSRLLWIDPLQPEPLWKFEAPGEELVGEPQLIDGMLVAAYQSGWYVGLDPATGQKLADGYRLAGSMAPACSPISFLPGRMFAPLTDGTVLLPALHRLYDPLEGFPVIW